MAFKCKLNVRSKIILENTTLEQVQQLNYLGYETSFIKERDVKNKIQKFQLVCGTISRTLKNKTCKDTLMKFYKTMAVPVLSYVSESWVISKEDKDKTQAALMRFLGRVKGCTRADRIRNVDIRAELNTYNNNNRLEENREKWKQHIDRMTETRIPNSFYNINRKEKEIQAVRRRDGINQRKEN
jgi:hypothetical protein